MIKIERLFLLFILVLFFSHSIFCQGNNIYQAINLSTIQADNLSDDQIKKFKEKYESSGMTWEQIELLAKTKGAKQIEIQKLKQRIDNLGLGSNAKNDEQISLERQGRLRKYSDDQKQNIIYDDTTSNIFNSLINKPVKTYEIFGTSLFSNKSLTFYPNLNIPTPKNYIIGPGDELIIDIWGTSQNSYQKTITPEGSFLIPEIGHIYISGMTIEEATIKLKNELSRMYSGLISGNTFLKISIGGTLRSVRVNVTGDVNLPGSYTLPSLASVFHALYLAGGPSKNGTLRNVKVIRNNELIEELDIYNFLMKGELDGNVRLEDQDIIFVSPYSRRVLVKGQVKREAYYDVKINESLCDLFVFCGGFTTKAYTLKYRVERKDSRYNKMFNVNISKADTFKLSNGDCVEVDSIIDKYENRVEIDGAVFRPGYFGISDTTSLLDLIEMADGLRGDAFLPRATLFRTNDDYSTQLLSVDLSSVLRKDTQIILKKDDFIKIYSIFDLKEEYSFRIEGEVQNPGDYYFSQNTTLEDLIAMAGGFKESASDARIEVARRIKKPEKESNQTAEILYFTVSHNLELNNLSSKFELKPFDQVFVRRSPSYEIQKNVFVIGEVKYPGTYSISYKNEYVSDLIIRAGGLTDDAYVNGGSLIRKKVLNNKKRELVLQTLNNLDSLGIDTSFTDEKIGIQLEKIISNPHSRHDLLLREGDILQIPQKLQTVRVGGSVLYPASIKYSSHWGARRYISMAGGFNEKARKSYTYVIYPSGRIKRTHNFVFFKLYPGIEPGSEIVVPMKEQKPPMTAEKFIGIGTSMASLVSLVLIIVSNI